jgi:hypothetical protein
VEVNPLLTPPLEPEEFILEKGFLYELNPDVMSPVLVECFLLSNVFLDEVSRALLALLVLLFAPNFDG